ncbi:hypothetical protein ACDV62_21095, partial [Proteus mirabilis]
PLFVVVQIELVSLYTGGFGDVEKAVKIFFRNELTPLQSKILQINDWLGEEVIKLDKYTLDDK